MNVVIAIDSFKGSMTSLEAGESASAGIRRIYPDADITIRPLADGGEGTVEALTLGCGGTRTQVCVTGPLEKPVLCSYGILDYSFWTCFKECADPGRYYFWYGSGKYDRVHHHHRDHFCMAWHGQAAY